MLGWQDVNFFCYIRELESEQNGKDGYSNIPDLFLIAGICPSLRLKGLSDTQNSKNSTSGIIDTTIGDDNTFDVLVHLF